MPKKEKERVNFRRNTRIYFNFVKKYKWFYFLLILVILILESARLSEKFLFKLIIDSGTEFSSGSLILESLMQILIGVALAFVFILILKSAMHWLQMHYINRLDSNVIFDIKNKFFNHIIQLSHNFHTTHKTGSLISRISRGSRAVERMTDFLIFNLVPLILQVIIISTTFIYFDVLSTVTVLLTVLIFILFSLYVSHIQQPANLEANNADDREKANIGDIFTNIDSVKYYGKEYFVKNRYSSLSSDTKLKYIKLWDYMKRFDMGQSLILGIGTFFLIFFPIRSFINGEITIGTVAFIYTAYLGLLSPLYGFVHSIRGVYEAMADFQALFNYSDIENEIKDKPSAKDLEIKNGAIEFKSLLFKYHKRPVINNLSLKINPGEKIALVGHSGSGKTTLVKLLYRFYNLNSGSILIDGENIDNFKQESLRSELSIVPQECILFDDTIYNNILFSNPSASKEEVMNAIKFAQLDKFVKSLPYKENTIVGERGVKLSGGEKQRVSIARAILANKKVLVLDEATSSLDSKTEYEIQKDLQKLMKGRTSIIIAHRLSTILSADKIVVMQKGKIVQIGKHRDLVNKPGVYKELWTLQKGGYIVDE